MCILQLTPHGRERGDCIVDTVARTEALACGACREARTGDRLHIGLVHITVSASSTASGEWPGDGGAQTAEAMRLEFADGAAIMILDTGWALGFGRGTLVDGTAQAAVDACDSWSGAAAFAWPEAL